MISIVLVVLLTVNDLFRDPLATCTYHAIHSSLIRHHVTSNQSIIFNVIWSVTSIVQAFHY